MTAPAPTPRILFVIGSLREGGTEGQLLQLARGLRARGWRVAIMLLREEGVRLAAARAEGLEIFPARVPVFRPRWSPLPWLLLPLMILRSAWWLACWRPDLVQAYLFWGHLWARLVLLFVPGRIPLVVSRRQTISDKGTSRLLQALENWCSRRACLLIANARAVAAAARARERHLPPIRVVHNGIDPAAFAATPPTDLRREFPALAGARRIAVTVANILPHKGYPRLLRAFAAARREDPTLALLCIGADGGQLPAMERLAAELGLTGHIVFAGSRRDIAPLLRGADFAVHASDDEGFSNAILEYMAAGLATVATDAGGNAEAIRHWKDGLIVPPHDEARLASCIVDLATSPSLCRRLGTSAQKRVTQLFTTPRMVEKTARLYRKVMGQTPGN